eukprot:7365928-Prymnesium_polylepis.1
MSLNNYKIVEFLGKGAFGEVHRAVDEHGESVAIKRIDTSKLKSKSPLRAPPADAVSPAVRDARRSRNTACT